MRSLCHVAILACLLVPLLPVPANADYFNGKNMIGLFTTETPTSPDDAITPSTSGLVQLYLVIANPWNDETHQPIANFGGYELELEFPGSWGIFGPIIYPFVSLTDPWPPFQAYGDFPASGGQFTTLASFQIASFAVEPGDVYMSPVSLPAIEGSLTILDADDDYHAQVAYPMSCDFDAPVFGIGTSVVKGHDKDWIAGCGEPMPTHDWTVGISALGDDGNLLGVATEAHDGYDTGWDLADTDLTVTFHRPEWDTLAGTSYFREDIRAPYQPLISTKSWTFELNVPAEALGTDVTVDFAPSFAEIDGIELMLRDVGAGVDVSLWPDLSYTFPAVDEAHAFLLTVGAEDAPPLNLQVEITGQIGEFEDAGNVVGTNGDATDGYDAGLDVPEPGPPPGGYLVVSIEHPDWPMGPRFTRDIREVYNPLTEARSWPLLVETDVTGTAALFFQPGFPGGIGVGMRLTDLDSGEEFNLFPSPVHVFETSGPTVRRFELSVGGVTVPPVEPSARAVPIDWSLVGPPLEPEAGSVTLGDMILQRAPGAAYAYAYRGPAGYEMMTSDDVVAVGEAVWLATDEAFEWSYPGEPFLESVRDIPLDVGWNLVGYPLWFPGVADLVEVSREGDWLSWGEALAANWVTGFMGHDPVQDDYVPTNQLAAWHGYWIGTNFQEIVLRFNWQDFAIFNESWVPVGKTDTTNPLATEWRLDLALDDGSGRIRTAIVGAQEGASADYEATADRFMPPSSPASGSRIAVVRPDWNLPCGNALAVDLVDPGEIADAVWTIRVTRHEPGPVTVSWRPDDLPAHRDFELYVPGEQRIAVASMRDRDAVDLQVGTGTLDLVMRAQGADDDGRVPFAGYGLAVHPNPFNPTATISFEMPRTARADVRVYDVRGRLVAELGGEVLAAGRGEVVWNGRTRAGAAAASGSYFARLIVEGEEVGETARMSLVR